MALYRPGFGSDPLRARGAADRRRSTAPDPFGFPDVAGGALNRPSSHDSESDSYDRAAGRRQELSPAEQGGKDPWTDQ